MTTTPDLVRPVDPYRSAAVYASRPVAIATRHGKAEVLADVLAAGGLFLVPVPVDTDRFGTFTGEVPRVLDLLGAATAKARLGAAASGLALNIASEGSFAPEEATGALVVQREVVTLVDAQTGLVVHGRAVLDAPWVRSWRCTVGDDVAGLVEGLDLRRHRLVVRPARPGGDPGAHEGTVTTGVADLEALRAAVTRAAAAGPEVVVETDLRAHVCPMRHPGMRAAAVDLVVRLATRCPVCESPGFGPGEGVPGAPCRDCGDATDAVAAVRHTCPACRYREDRPGAEPLGDPALCGSCNP